MQHENDQIVHEDIIIPDESQDNQDDARLNEAYMKSKESENSRKEEKEKLYEEKLKEKKFELEYFGEID